MRIDLYNNRRRPLPARLALGLMTRRVGFASPPLVFFSYAPTLLGLRGCATWRKPSPTTALGLTGKISSSVPLSPA